MIQKQTVYLPVNTDEPSLIVQEYQREITVDLVKDVEGYFFTPEQLNEYTQKVIKQALEIAAERAYALVKDHDLYIREYVGTEYSVDIDMSEGSPLQYGCSVITDKQSITNTFEETFKKFEI